MFQESKMATRTPQIVSTKKQRKLVIEWMMKEVEESGTDKEILIKATEKFNSIFKIADSRSKIASIRKANRWWNEKEQFLNALTARENREIYVRCKSVAGFVEERNAVKALHGRGRKRHDWVEYLHQVLLCEFERLSSSDMQLSRAFIQNAALSLSAEEDSACTS